MIALRHYSNFGTVKVKCPLDKQKCPLDIHIYVHSSNGRIEMSIGHKYMSIRPLDEQKCPLDIQMSIRPLDEWTNGHCLMASTLVSYPHGVRRMLNTTVFYPQGVMLDRITSLQQFWHCKSKMSIGQTEMSIGHSYICPFVQWTNRNVHWT